MCTEEHFNVYQYTLKCVPLYTGTQICPNMSKTRGYVINDYPADFNIKFCIV